MAMVGVSVAALLVAMSCRLGAVLWPRRAPAAATASAAAAASRARAAGVAHLQLNGPPDAAQHDAADARAPWHASPYAYGYYLWLGHPVLDRARRRSVRRLARQHAVPALGHGLGVWRDDGLGLLWLHLARRGLVRLSLVRRAWLSMAYGTQSYGATPYAPFGGSAGFGGMRLMFPAYGAARSARSGSTRPITRRSRIF